MVLADDDWICESCSDSDAIAISSVLAEKLGVEESDCERFSLEASSVVKTLLDRDVLDLRERELDEPSAASELRVCCGRIEESTILKSSLGGGGDIDLADERGLESGLGCAAGVLRLVVVRLANWDLGERVSCSSSG